MFRVEIKAALEQVRVDLREMELRLNRQIAYTKLDLLKWLVALMFAQVGAIAVLVKFF